MLVLKKTILNWRTPPEILGLRKKEQALFFDREWSNNGTMTEYTCLTSRMTPVWTSAIKIGVQGELRAAFDNFVEAFIDHASFPDAVPQAPTVPLVHPNMAFIYFLISIFTSQKGVEH